mmetsp:Transcript_21681/g.39777  ORF Transcript_21681/g.39777 Transcript_21681/m.39777 type:complete len:376 (+) Transcript_21681:62-1189(+)
MSLPVCSWNLLAPSLHEAHEGGMRWELRRPALRAWVQELAATHNILCFQEAERSSVLQELHDVLGPLGFDAVALNRSETLVNVTFFKTSVVTLTRVEKRSRVLLSKLSFQDGRDMMVVNVHLEAGDHESQRVAQLRSALQRASAQRAVVTVVCGDFNSTLEPDSRLRQMLQEYGLSQGKLQGGVTYSVEGFSAVLDHIWADADLIEGSVLRSEASAQGTTLWLPDQHNPSDHLPVRAILAMPAAEKKLLEALNQPIAPDGAVQPDMDIMEEWRAILRSARQPGNKRNAKEQRKLEKMLLDVVQPEEAAFMQGYRSWASNVAAVVAASIAAKASANSRMFGAEACLDKHCTSCATSKGPVTCWDPGGALLVGWLGG